MRKIDLDAERRYENQNVTSNGSQRKAQGKYYWATNLSEEEHLAKTDSVIKGKAVLEIGCSDGRAATRYTQFAQSYVGVDISDEAIRAAESIGLPNARFICTDGHFIPLEKGSFDCVIVNGLLHHLDLESAFKEIHRLLKIGGVLIFREPLGINPLFQLYRRLTPAARTADERPLDQKDINLLQRYFELEDVQYFGFLSVTSAFFMTDWFRRLTTHIDKVIAATPLKIFCWQFSGVARKRSI
jgi:SAM-dependent methyltransferase